MTHLSKIIQCDSISWNKFMKDNPELQKNVPYTITFQNGELVSLETKNELMLAWALTKGLS
jgi:hypothetical protein